MKKIDTLESIMFALESPKAANYAGVLQVFDLPARSGKAYLDRVHHALLACEPSEPFNQIPYTYAGINESIGESTYANSSRHIHGCIQSTGNPGNRYF